LTAANALLVALAAASWLALVARIAAVAARMLQIEEYENRRFLAWACHPGWLAHRSALGGATVALAGLVLAQLDAGAATPIVAASWLAAAVAGHLAWRWVPPKRALSLTARMRRLLAASALMAIAISAAVALLVLAAPRPAAVAVLVATGGVTALVAVLLVLGELSMRPAEAGVRRHYLRRARGRVAELDPLVVAVAGSYGKTSTKHILARLLGEGVLPTRKSFNTLMGVTRVVNEDLRAEHRVFIVEMDAYAPGEIESISALVRPRFAILTSVGPQHLERFGTLARIEDALYESVAALPPDGTAVIHTGDAGGRALALRARGEHRTVVRYALEESDGDADVSVSAVEVGSAGTTFEWRWASRRLEHAVAIPLLGRHQALNVAAALAMVVVLDRSLDDALAAVVTLEPVEHRLQTLHTGGPVTVIDDSYNANPVGVHEGLEVLASFPAGAKILVTPGLVELGSVEDEENRRYGRHAAAVCDHVIVAEARPAAALLAGLREGGMSQERIHRVSSLAETTAMIGRIAAPGDTVLFANDLPDTYIRNPVRRPAATATGTGR